MSHHPAVLSGVVHGRTIEFTSDLGYAEGQTVAVVVQPLPASTPIPSREGLAAAFGAWANEEGLDEYLEWCRQDRQRDRRMIEP